MNNNLFKGLPNFFTKQGLAIVFGLLGTGIGAYGGMPTPPQTFLKAVEKYSFLQWFLVYVLIWQGAGSFDEKLSLYGTIIVFIVYRGVIFLETNYDLVNKLGLETRLEQSKQE